LDPAGGWKRAECKAALEIRATEKYEKLKRGVGGTRKRREGGIRTEHFLKSAEGGELAG